MSIFYILYHAQPSPDSEAFESCGGAYAACWVQADSEPEAEKISSAAILEAGWTIVAVEEECREISEDGYSEDDAGREHYQQAVTDGECYVIHQWPPEPQEGDHVH